MSPARSTPGAAGARTAALAGSYPREETLVKATWNADKALLAPAELRRVRLDAAKRVVDLQRRLGFQPVTNGQLAWQDAFRPILESTPSLGVGGLQRLFETNKFYRQPVLHEGLPGEAPALAADAFEGLPKSEWKAILPSPYWFGAAILDETGSGREAVTLALGAFLNSVARRLEHDGCAEVQFNEPALFYEKQPDLRLAKRSLGGALQGLSVGTTVAFPNGDAAPHWDWVAQLPAKTVGIDFIETPLEDLPVRPFPLGLQAQIVDSQQSHVEDGKELAALAGKIESRLRPARLVLSHTWDLEFVPSPVADRKLEVLSTLLAGEKVVA